MSKVKGKKSPDNEPDKNYEKTETSLFQAIGIIITTLVLFFALLEGGLTLFGVHPVLHKSDPFVGFAGNVPLFTEAKAANGSVIYTTADNKLTHFNQQMFLKEKSADSYRIFTVGGSTTYGRPYNDLTSFSGWLREMLLSADKKRDWEVINAGGISYASYRVARLMEELVQYQPDLFVVYTGQNEFLEERTYRELKNLPDAVRTTVGLLAKTRTWAVTNAVLHKVGLVSDQTGPQNTRLTSEVNAILDNSTGPEDYQRDDQLQKGVLHHYRVSLERMADIARAAGAQIIFVTPASNLKDCSPFKSEHTDALNKVDRQTVLNLMTAGKKLIKNQEWRTALIASEQALTLDPRYAELHYLRGKALFELKQYDAALLAFQKARDEDVCPLRALTSMPAVVADVAGNKKVPLVDFVAQLETQLQREKGHRIPGEGLFLDHVHPTIDGHRILAVSLVEKMIELGIISSDSWNQAVVESATEQIEARIDPHFQSKSLVNLAKVLHWAGKMDDARRSAEEAITVAQGDPQLIAQAINVLIKIAKAGGDQEKLGQYLEQALAVDPWSPIMHYHLGVKLLQEKQRQKAAAHVLLASTFWDTNQTNSLLGLILYKNEQFDLAYPLLAKALRQKPGDSITEVAATQLQLQLGQRALKLPPVKFRVRRYPSGLPSEIHIVTRAPQGRAIANGFVAGWHENGHVKMYKEIRQGKSHGLTVEWNLQGEEITRQLYQNGSPQS